jgi:tRNA(fMet)-specific endonuclease VapC
VYLFDINILSELVKRSPSAQLVERLRSVPRGRRFAASITAAELIFGALLLGEDGRALLGRIERDLLRGLTVLPFDDIAARRFAEVKAELWRRGEPVGDADLQIAAIALVGGLTVVTANTRHFARVRGVAAENWLSSEIGGR